MANSYSTQDCVKGALQIAGEVTDGTSSFHQLALKYVDKVHREVIKGNSLFDPELREPWTWARQTSSFQIPAFYSGTASLTQGLTSGTFSVAPTISLAGYFFVVLNRQTYYKISAHVANSVSFTLDMVYLEGTGSALSFSALPLIVDLGAGIQRLVEPLRIYDQRVLEFGETASDMGRIYGMDPIQFWKDWPLQLIQNDTPSKFITIFRSESSWKVQFNKYTAIAMRVEYDYIPIPLPLTDSSQSIPLIPRDEREILEYGAAYYLLIDKRQKEDATLMFGVVKAKLTSLKESDRSSEKYYGSIFGELVARRDDTAIPYWVIEK